MTNTAEPARRKPRPPIGFLVRQLHTWLSVFVAPSVLFFAVTGALQVYKLHESHGAYQAPQLVQELGAVHKDQIFEASKKRGPPPGEAAPALAAKAPAAQPEPATPLSVAALKLFFAFVAASLVITTLMGLWMAAKYSRNKVLCAVLFGAGVLVPLATFLLG